MTDILVIGGGAAGMMAALTAAENKENRVLLLERQQRVGRKLLATGNGRCNLTNTGASPDKYHGEAPDFVRPALEMLSAQDALALFRSFGLLTVTEAGGRVYPLSDAAGSVLDVLRFQLMQRGVDLRCSCTVRQLRREKTGFAVVTEAGETLRADALIVACGGMAGEKLGGVADGYQLLKMLGHRRTALYPALVQLSTDTDYPRALKGVRADAALTLRRGERVLGSACGELQFTERGVSGPAAFDLSRLVATGGEGLSLHIDLLRDYSHEELLHMLRARQEKLPDLETAELLTGLVQNRLGKMLLRYASVEQKGFVRDLSDQQLRRAVDACKSFVLKLHGTEGFDKAQVTAGGVRTADFDPETLQSRLVPGLYACGEVLDIDGDCGGYNLQWAWASGRLAGRLLP